MKQSIARKFLAVLLIVIPLLNCRAESGYDLWLRYSRITDQAKLLQAVNILGDVSVSDEDATMLAIRNELLLATERLTGVNPVLREKPKRTSGLVIAAGVDSLPAWINYSEEDYKKMGNESFLIYRNDKNDAVIILSKTPVGALYGTFRLLRIIQHTDLENKLPLYDSPRITHRLLNHWDNLDRTVERGYAGFSIWDWHKLPGYIDQRYIDYARANASIGINGTVLTNVNANAWVLTPMYLEKVAALADVFRPFGIKVYLTARFSAPIEIGGLKTADPAVREVREWWNVKADEIYKMIPDFGGFLVKANSEGQPGPQNYGRSHAEGANMIADAVGKHGGIVMWRAFVYSHESPEDRAKQANLEFEPLDGQFLDNVVIQVKNGAIDFQPREPFHPLFGAMDSTALALELQITQEYLGQGTSLCFLAPMYTDCLNSATARPNDGSTVASVIDGSAYNRELSVMAGVSNIGNDINWTGHPFGQSNWYAYGRLAWDPGLTPSVIAHEWISLTFGDDPELIHPLLDIMLKSHEMVVNYMTPMGLHHIMGRNHHYGPGPWVTGGRADWTSVYYHRADSAGVGFDRSTTGSKAVSQYAPEIARIFDDPATCPEKFLLWFHHLPWDYKMKSGNTLWEEICYHYDLGVKQVENSLTTWNKLEGHIDIDRFEQVHSLLNIQYEEAEWWRNSCLLYFKQFSGLPLPQDIVQPEGELEEYMKMSFPYAPGIRPSW